MGKEFENCWEMSQVDRSWNEKHDRNSDVWLFIRKIYDY